MKPAFWDWSRIDLRIWGVVRVGLCGFGAGAILLTIALFVLESFSSVAPVRYEKALRWIEPLDVHDWSYTGFSALARKAPDLSRARWETISLPDSIPLPARAELSDDAPIARAWFRVRYMPSAPLSSDEQIEVFVSRIMGGAWCLYANGQLIASNADDWRMQWNHPVRVRLPLALSQPGQPVDIALAVPYRLGQGYALGTLQVGSATEIAPIWNRRVFFQLTLPLVGMITTLLLGVFSFSFWLMRRGETQQLYMTLASIAWVIFALQFFQDIDSDATGARWFAAIVDASPSWMFLLMYLFALHITSHSYPRIVSLMACYVVADSVLTLPVWNWQVNGFLLQHWLHIVFYLFICLHVSWFVVQVRRTDVLVLCVALWGCIFAGIHDLMYPSAQVDPDAYHFTAYAVFFVFLAFQYANQRRHIAAQCDVENANQRLNQRLAEREAELRQNYVHLATIEQQRTLLLERQRLMQDMHDGVGSALISSLAMVEQGEMAPEDVAGMLHECVDELRLVIHSLEPIAHDLTTLLASLRQRIGKRLEASGIRLYWHMDDIPPLPWLEAPQALQILRIVQESLTNILKHARATEVRISAGFDLQAGLVQHVQVCVADNGVGFDASSVDYGHGLKNIHERARRLGGELLLDSTPGKGSVVKLLLPSFS